MNKAYLVIDMSNDFVDDNGSLSVGKKAQAIVPAVLRRINKFYNDNDYIIFCMDNHTKGDKHFELWPEHCIKDTWGAQLYGDIGKWYEARKKEDNVIYIPKTEYDAFYKTDLAVVLIQNDVKDVYLSGVCTDICVFNTAYGAYKNGFKTYISPDECATFTDNQNLFIQHMNAIYKTEII